MTRHCLQIENLENEKSLLETRISDEEAAQLQVEVLCQKLAQTEDLLKVSVK